MGENGEAFQLGHAGLDGPVESLVGQSRTQGTTVINEVASVEGQIGDMVDALSSVDRINPDPEGIRQVNLLYDSIHSYTHAVFDHMHQGTDILTRLEAG